MRRVAVPHRVSRSLALILGGVICLQGLLGSLLPASAGAGPLNLPDQGGWIYLPVVMANYVPPQGRLCRFGVGAGSDIATYRVNDLRIGWYTNWGSSLKPARPGGIEYLQMVRLSQTGPAAYTASPNGATLLAIIAANPGALWVIGNEPDRRSFQDSLEPQVYAIAYHDLYHQIKGADPTSRIVAGSIVQPTNLRLQYLQKVLDSYLSRYGVAMPVDVWNIHAFILNEQSCNPACPGYNNCWGAGIPPGISACTGETYTIDQSDNLPIFEQSIVNFRMWMRDHNYQDRPLIITEFGVLQPPDYGSPPFGPARVNAFMNATFQYLSTATDSQRGYAADKQRLVQAWAWYSLSDNTAYNGWLFDPVTKARTALGDNFAAYTAGVTPYVNLTPLKVWLDSSHTPRALVASVSNNGNIEFPATTVVRFYDGDPAKGGVQIGSDQLLPRLNGCANTASVRTPWTSAVPGTTRTIWVVVDPGNFVTESDEADNRMSASVLVPS